MKSFIKTGVALALGLSLTGHALAQSPNAAPSYPATRTSPVVQEAGFRGTPSVGTGIAAPLRGGEPRYFTPGRNTAPSNLDPTVIEGPNQSDPVPEYTGAPAPPADGTQGPIVDQSTDPTCGPDASCIDGWLGGNCGPKWFGGVGGLIMTRDRANNTWLSYDQNNSDVTRLYTNDAAMTWAGGVETRLGRYLNGGQNALEAVYWGVYPGTQEACIESSDPVNSSLRSTLDFSSLQFTGPNGLYPVTDVLNSAMCHRYQASNNFQNIEINFLGYGCCGPTWNNGACASPLNFSWLGGIRYFRFEDCFNYYAWTPSDFFNYDINTINNLFGVQLGGRMDYWATQSWRVYSGIKFGLYGNQISQSQVINNSVAAATVQEIGCEHDGQQYWLSSSKTDAAFLGELDLGTSYQITRRWSAYAGYRAVAATGVALTNNQIPTYLCDIQDACNIDSNGSLILHGVYAGIGFNW